LIIKLIIPVVDTPDTRKANEGVSHALKTLNPDTQVSISFIEHGFEALNTITRVGYNSPGIVKAAIKAEKEQADGILVNCVADPAVDMVRELVSVPVFGGFRATMMMALGCGKNVSIIIPGKEDWAGKLLLSKVIEKNNEFKSSIVHKGFTNLDVLELHDKSRLLKRLADFAEESFAKYDSDCVVLGCTAMSYIIDDLRNELAERRCPVTVLEPLSTGLKVLETFIALGFNNSLADRVANDMNQFK
jgi:allantoin racemase